MIDARNTFQLHIVATDADMSRAAYDAVYRSPGEMSAALRAFADAIDGTDSSNSGGKGATPTELMQKTLGSKKRK